MEEDIASAIVWLDEAEALEVIESIDNARGDGKSGRVDGSNRHGNHRQKDSRPYQHHRADAGSGLVSTTTTSYTTWSLGALALARTLHGHPHQETGNRPLERCTNKSSPPLSRSMKPNPFSGVIPLDCSGSAYCVLVKPVRRCAPSLKTFGHVPWLPKVCV